MTVKITRSALVEHLRMMQDAALNSDTKSVLDISALLLKNEGIVTPSTDKLNKKYRELLENNLCQDNHSNLLFLIEQGVDINIQGNHGNTALIWACIHSVKEFASQLVELGANLNAQDASGYTALHAACISSDSDWLMKLLLGAGADFEIKNNYGETPLDIAIKRGHVNGVTLINRRKLHLAEVDGSDSRKEGIISAFGLIR